LSKKKSRKYKVGKRREYFGEKKVRDLFSVKKRKEKTHKIRQCESL
jgi:hypothetical protein